MGQLFQESSDFLPVLLDKFDTTLQSVLPELHTLFHELDVPFSFIFLEWLTCVFVSSLEYETLLRTWDMFFLEGMEGLFMVAVNVLRALKPQLLEVQETESIMIILRCGIRSISADELFSFNSQHVAELAKSPSSKN